MQYNRSGGSQHFPRRMELKLIRSSVNRYFERRKSNLSPTCFFVSSICQTYDHSFRFLGTSSTILYPSAKDTFEKRLSVGILEDIVLKGGISYMPSLAASIHDDFNQIVVISSDIRYPTSDIRHPISIQPWTGKRATLAQVEFWRESF